MTTQAAILAEARTWLDTPFVHQGRVKGVGVDCWGVLGETLRACGIDIPDKSNYAHIPRAKDIWDYCRELEAAGIAKRVRDALQPADALIITLKTQAHHMGFYTERGTLLHALCSPDPKSPLNKVEEIPYRPPWPERTLAVYRLAEFCA